MNEKKPLGVWIILGWYVFKLLWLGTSHYMIFSGKLPLSPEQRSHFDQYTLADHALTFIVPLYCVFAALNLFAKRAVSYRLFQALLVLVPVSKALDIVRMGGMVILATGGAATIVTAFVGYAVDIAVFVFVKRLKSANYFS